LLVEAAGKEPEKEVKERRKEKRREGRTGDLPENRAVKMEGFPPQADHGVLAEEEQKGERPGGQGVDFPAAAGKRFAQRLQESAGENIE
jgi:hypothetical protein